MPDPTDTELMQRAQQGDEGAFVALVERYQRGAVNLAYRYLGDRTEAEDLAQEAFVRAWQARGSFDARRGFRAWFYRILTNLCLSEGRRRGRAQRRAEALQAELEGAPPAGDPEDQPEASLQAQERARAVRLALARLPERQRLATILHHYEGLNYAEIARSMGCSRGTVDGLISRGMASLRKWLRDSLE